MKRQPNSWIRWTQLTSWATLMVRKNWRPLVNRRQVQRRGCHSSSLTTRRSLETAVERQGVLAKMNARGQRTDMWLSALRTSGHTRKEWKSASFLHDRDHTRGPSQGRGQWEDKLLFWSRLNILLYRRHPWGTRQLQCHQTIRPLQWASLSHRSDNLMLLETTPLATE